MLVFLVLAGLALVFGFRFARNRNESIAKELMDLAAQVAEEKEAGTVSAEDLEERFTKRAMRGIWQVTFIIVLGISVAAGLFAAGFVVEEPDGKLDRKPILHNPL